MKLKDVEERIEERRKAFRVHKLVGSAAYTVASGCICYLLAQMGSVGIIAALAIVVKQAAHTLAEYQQLKALQEWQEGVNRED